MISASALSRPASPESRAGRLPQALQSLAGCLQFRPYKLGCELEPYPVGHRVVLGSAQRGVEPALVYSHDVDHVSPPVELDEWDALLRQPCQRIKGDGAIGVENEDAWRQVTRPGEQPQLEIPIANCGGHEYVRRNFRSTL